MSQYIFVSYSRVQLHFARSVKRHLAHHGIEVWLDIERLLPGYDWRKGIEDGLSNATGIVLIASRSSLKSPYVSEEWQYGLANDLPVYVLFVEDLQLPGELSAQATTIMDFRHEFDHAIQSLVSCINGGSNCPRDTIQTPLPAYLPRVLLPEVRTLAWIITVPGLILGLMTAYYGWVYVRSGIPEDIGIQILYAIIASSSVLILWQRFRFIYHKCQYFELRLTLNLINYSGWIMLFLVVLVGLVFVPIRITASTARDIAGANAVLGVLAWMGLYGIVTQVMYWYFGHKETRFADNTRQTFSITYFEAIERWMPPGPDRFHQMRMLGNRRVEQSSDAQQSSIAVWYKLYYENADESIATHIKSAMNSQRHKLHEGLYNRAFPEEGVHIVVISRHTSTDRLKTLLDAKRIVPIIVDNTPILKEHEQLLRFQVIDYRMRDHYLLEEMAQAFAHPGDSRYGDSVVPRSFEKKIFPTLDSQIRRYGGIERLFQAMVAGMIFVALIVSWSINTFGEPPPPTFYEVATLQAQYSVIEPQVSVWTAGELSGEMRDSWQNTIVSVGRQSPLSEVPSLEFLASKGQVIWNPGPIITETSDVIQLELIEYSGNDPHNVQSMFFNPTRIETIPDSLVTVTEYRRSMQEFLYVIEGGNHPYIFYARYTGNDSDQHVEFHEALVLWARSLNLSHP